MPSYTPVTLPESEKRNDLRKIGLEGFELLEKHYGDRRRRPIDAPPAMARNDIIQGHPWYGGVSILNYQPTHDPIKRWGRPFIVRETGEEKQARVEREAKEERRAKAEREAKEQRAREERMVEEVSQARAQLVAEVEKRVRAEREVEEERWARAKEVSQTRAQLIAEVERRVRAEREVEEERRVKIERETEEEGRARAEREVEEQRARVERMVEEVSQAREQLVAEVERRVKAEREGEEERWAKAKREAEEERQARAKRKAEEDRWARIERLAEEVISKTRAQLVAEVERHARAEREREEERLAKAKREAEEEKQARVEREAEEERKAIAERMEEIVNGETLYKAICGNNWNRAKAFLDESPSVLTAKVTSSGKTALHVAALFGHVSIVEELVRLVPPDFLETTDDFGNTPLLIATVTGITQVAECLVNKNTNILRIPNSTKELPITLAFLNGHQEMGRYLYNKTPLQYLHPESAPLQGAMLLRCCLETQCFDIALDLLNRCPELLFESDEEGWKPIYSIVTMNSAIPSRNDLVFWKRFIFDYIDINSNPSLDHGRLPIQKQDTSERAQENSTGPGHCLLQWIISSTYNLIGIKKLQELKLLHAQADEILHLVCKNASRSDQVSVIADALFLAAKEGNVEFVLQISKANPDILLIGDSTYQNIFFYAVQNRQARVFNLIHGLRFKDIAATSIDIDGNTLLHVAATQAPAPFYNQIYGPTLQMQRELLWFKEVESLVPPTIRGARNKDGMSAEELFRESHRDLMKQGQKWVKATASSSSVVGTLIVTIVFAVAFTVPGGNDQNFGYPLFVKQPFFKIFLFSTILSLLSSSTSVLMFLAIFTSRYSEEKFLKSIPTKLMLGLSSLFISIVSMMVSFLSTICLMVKHTNYTWGVLPIITLAIIPIFLFVLSQFPLLLHTAFSTYGKIFNRKVEMWP